MNENIKFRIFSLFKNREYSLSIALIKQAHQAGLISLSDYEFNKLLTTLTKGDKLSLNDRRITERKLEELIMKRQSNVAKAFIVHGWDEKLRMEVELFLTKVLGVECIILFEKDSEGLTIIEKFEMYSAEADIAIVLLSDLDEPIDKIADINATRRPRPNVLFEMGYFFAKLGRRKTIIFKKGNVDLHSDIYGIEFIDVSASVESQGEKIRKRLGFVTG